MGVNDFIRKPIEVDELLARVRSLLRLKRLLDEQNHREKAEPLSNSEALREVVFQPDSNFNSRFIDRKK